MRTKNSVYNILGVTALYFVKILLSFVGKTCLIKVMGDEYNGINALFGSVISMLSIAELGIGTAIIYNLYKPVKENNIEAIKSIMIYYKKCYRLIAGIVLVLGIIMTLFIGDLIGELSIGENLYFLYYLFLLDAVCSYLFSYKRSIIYANQKNYIISMFDMAYVVLLQVLQITVLLYLRDFAAYLVVGIICKLLENILIQFYADKKYPYLKDKQVGKISSEIRLDIREKVKGLLFHRIGSYIVFGTDNLIISHMVNIVAEGLYSNYLTIINPLSNILSQMINALQPAVGNLLVENDKEKNFNVYKKISFINFWIYTVSSICLFYLIQDFIILWLGKEYLFELGIVFVLCVNFWQTGMRGALGAFKNAAGIYYEDRYIALAESIINILVSIILTYKYGIIGVFVGTFVSSQLLFLYSFPVLVYKPLFDKNYIFYIKEMLGYIGVWLFSFAVTYFMSELIEYIYVSNTILNFLLKTGSIFLTVNIILVLLYYRKSEFYYLKDILNKLFIRS